MGSQQVVMNPQQRILSTRDILEKAKDQIIQALPAHLKANDPLGERFRRIIISLVNAKGMENIPPSAFAVGAIRAAEIGLEPDPFYGHLFLIPYGQKLQPQIGYKGIIELGWRSGQVLDIRAGVVWKEDGFEYSEELSTRTFKHAPNLQVEHDWTKQEPIAAYAIARLKEGGEAIVVLPGHEVRRRRDRSQAVQSAKKYRKQTPWDTDPEAMWKKTAVRALAPWIPQCPQIAKALHIEDSEERNIDAIDVPFEPIVEDPEQTGEAPKDHAPDQTPSNETISDKSESRPLSIKDDFTPKEQNNIYTWLWAAKGWNKALVTDWVTRFQGTKEALLKFAEEEAQKASEGRQ